MTTLTKGHLEMVRGASKEPSRYAINGMHISPEGVAETTDGKMLIRLNGIPNPPEKSIIIDKVSVSNLAKNVKKHGKYSDKVATVEITSDKDEIGGDVITAVHESDGSKTTQTLEHIEGTFPKTNDVIPTDGQKVFRLDAVRLHLLLDTMIKANKANGNNVNLTDHLPVEFSVNIQPDQYGTRPVLIDFEVPADTEYDGKKLKGQAVLMPLADRR